MLDLPEGISLDIAEDSALPSLARAVAIDILVNGAQPRANLGERLGISAATVTRLVRPLLAAGVLVEAEILRTPGRGRAAVALDVVPDNYRFIGVKLTTDSVYAVATDLRARIVDREIVPLLSLDVPDVVETVCTVVRGMQARGGPVPVQAVGVTVGGLVAEGEVVADSPFLHWHDVPFRQLLAERLGVPVRLENDVVGLTTVQHWFGEGRGCRSFALLTVGAGIGYGLVVNHQRVPTGIAPMSHYLVDPAGPPCAAGHRGCMTALLTSGSIATAVSIGHGRLVSFEEALGLTADGDAVATRVVSDAARALGRSAAAVSAMTGVERIVLSGEGVGLAELAPDALRAGYTEYDVGEAQQAELVVRPMDFIEWARGAAAVAIQAEFPG
ncbi:ROK family protein [Promicromonospora vindobonensis]|uniref:ROK family protein n=1 Tax=Promicromonospora vindobonensis TaxID=195748 RepID=A0ABW5VV72_9MICO